jgi:hypothetical protein
LLDFGCAQYIENGIFEYSNDAVYWTFYPWFNGPESVLRKSHTYNNDVYILGWMFGAFNFKWADKKDAPNPVSDTKKATGKTNDWINKEMREGTSGFMEELLRALNKER